MQTHNKYSNCITSIKYALNYITEDDYITVIAFNNNIELVAEGLPGSEENKKRIINILNATEPSGGTNIGKALSQLHDTIFKLDHIANMKQGILFLTDGHATDGSTYTDDLTSIFDALISAFHSISISTIGYGTDHNSYLLKYIAQEGNGSYSIVNNLLNVSAVIGYIIGSLISCVCYDVVITATATVGSVQPATCLPMKYCKETRTYTIRIGDVVADQIMHIPFVCEKDPGTGEDANITLEVKGTYVEDDSKFTSQHICRINDMATASELTDSEKNLIATEELRYRLTILLNQLAVNEISLRNAISEKNKLLEELAKLPSTELTRMMISELHYISSGADLSMLSQHSSVFGMNRGMHIVDDIVNMSIMTPTQAAVSRTVQRESRAEAMEDPCGAPPGCSPSPPPLLPRTSTIRRI
jgi:hypothetical protein